MSDEVMKQLIKIQNNTAKKVKSSEEAMEVVKEIKQLLQVISALCHDLPTNKVKYLKD